MGHKSQGGAAKDTYDAITVGKQAAAGIEGIDIILMRIPTEERPRECSRPPRRSSALEKLESWDRESGAGGSGGRSLACLYTSAFVTNRFPAPLLFPICIHHGPGPSCARVHT